MLLLCDSKVNWQLLYIFLRPWHTLGHVDTAIYGAPSSGVTRRQVQLQTWLWNGCIFCFTYSSYFLSFFFFSTFRYLRSFKCMVILLWENMDANQPCEMWQGWVTLSSSWYYVAVWKMCHIPLYITSHRRRNRVCQEPFFLQTLKHGADNFMLLFAIFSWVINDFFLNKK